MSFVGISLALKFAENAYTVGYNGQSKTGVDTWLKPFGPSRCIKASFQIAENRLNFPTSKGFRMNIKKKWFTNTWQFSLISHPLQIIFIHEKSRITIAIRGL